MIIIMIMTIINIIVIITTCIHILTIIISARPIHAASGRACGKNPEVGKSEGVPLSGESHPSKIIVEIIIIIITIVIIVIIIIMIILIYRTIIILVIIVIIPKIVIISTRVKLPGFRIHICTHTI